MESTRRSADQNPRHTPLTSLVGGTALSVLSLLSGCDEKVAPPSAPMHSSDTNPKSSDKPLPISNPQKYVPKGDFANGDGCEELCEKIGYRDKYRATISQPHSDKDMKCTDLREATLEGLDMTGVDFTCSDMKSAKIKKTTFGPQGCDDNNQDGAKFGGVRWINGATICDEDFKGMCADVNKNKCD